MGNKVTLYCDARGGRLSRTLYENIALGTFCDKYRLTNVTLNVGESYVLEC